MGCKKICLALAVLAVVNGLPSTESSFRKDSALDVTLEEMRSMCDKDDAISCLKFKAISFLEDLLRKDSYKISDTVEVNRNSYRSNEISSRSQLSLDAKIEEYVKNHEVTFTLPMIGSKVSFDARNLNQDEIDLKLSFSDSTGVQARKSKLKKIFIPILVFVLLKAMTLIPLALGVLGLKAWNALQLSFFSFVVSVALAVFQLCKKLATDNNPPQIAAHGAWDAAAYSSHYAARSLDESPDAQKLAYSAYTK